MREVKRGAERQWIVVLHPTHLYFFVTGAARLGVLVQRPFRWSRSRRNYAVLCYSSESFRPGLKSYEGAIAKNASEPGVDRGAARKRVALTLSVVGAGCADVGTTFGRYGAAAKSYR